jgi:uncharacterized repeat protein (TIGR01451 family)
MRPRPYLHGLWALALLSLLAAGPALPPSRPAALFALTFQWQRCNSTPHWCETGWYASPAAADIDNDGQVEVVWGGYTPYAVNGATGAIEWNRPASGNRIWPGIAVADLTGNGSLEVVVASHDGRLNIYDGAGSPLSAFNNKQVNGMSNELRTLAVYDLDANGDMEIVVATTNGPSTGKQHWYVYEHDGSLRPGWPQLYAGSPGFAAGAYNQNVGIGDLDGDGRGEIIGPNDTHYLTAYHDNGAEMLTHARYGLLPGGGLKPWSRVGLHVSDAVDLRGYANCGTEHRPNMANSAAAIADLRGNGTLQVVVIGNVYNCAGSYTDLYEMPFVFNADRTRWASGPYDWTVIPSPDCCAAPLSEDYSVIENSLPNPVLADLDGDGQKEILYASYDGRVHAYWLDKTEHGSWPFELVGTAGCSPYCFASEPVVADLNADGQAEVIFASWTRHGSYQPGKLYVVSPAGTLLQSVNLPRDPASDFGGALGAPTLANLDADANLEVVVGTVDMGLVAYELADSANARLLWGTGRGSLLRAGSVPVGSLGGSSKQVSNPRPSPGETVTYTLRLANIGPILYDVVLTDTLPLNASLVGGSVAASSGAWGTGGGLLTWTGDVTPTLGVTITYRMAIDAGLVQPTAITNAAVLDDGQGHVLTRTATAIVNALELFLPALRR